MKTREFTGAPVIRTVPGDILRQELDARGLSQRGFAEKIGRPEQLVSEIIRGKKRITAETALDFAEALGIAAEFWLNLEVNFELDQARSRRHVRRARADSRVPRQRRLRRESA
jgi:HTH-type transcriptional regulator / antitoxin HigA